MIKKILAALLLFPTFIYAQINTDRVMMPETRYTLRTMSFPFSILIK